MRRGLIVWAILAGVVALGGCKVETFWSPDGKSVAYLADGRLRVYDVATRESKPLDTGDGRVISAAWSPDGQRIAFCAASLGKEAGVSLRVIELTSGKVSTLVLDIWPLPREALAAEEVKGESPEEALRAEQEDALGDFEYVASLAWSPDGKRLAYVGTSQSGGGIFLLTYPAEAIEPIASRPHVQVAPAWSPDGRWLAYVHPSSSPVELAPERGDTEPPEQAPEPDSVWLYDLAAGDAHKVCDVPGHALAVGTQLRWSGESRRLGFIAIGTEGEGIGCLVEARPGAAVKQALPGISTLAAWSPGLDAVAWVGDAGETGEVPVLYRSVGAETPRVLGHFDLPAGEEPAGTDVLFDLGEVGAAPCSLPQFSPDGSRVALRIGEKPGEIKVVVFAVK